jgi:hypothetical protein
MNRPALNGAVLVMGTALSLLLPAGVFRSIERRTNIEGPPDAHTGGFGEPTCRECHGENALNVPGGILGVEGVPTAYEPGERYRIAVVLQSDDMESAGFQAAFRFNGGDARGRQAGQLAPIDTKTTVRTSPATGIEYVQHSARGSETSPGALATWTFWWTAPRDRAAVILHVAANSANGDNSPLGDLIYTIHETTRAVTAPR